MPLHPTGRLRSMRPGIVPADRPPPQPAVPSTRPRRAALLTAATLAAAAVAAAYLLALAPLLPIGIDDLGIAAVFSTDEALSGRIVRAMVRSHSLSPDHFFAYGALYHEAAALPLVLLSRLDPGDRAALLSLRMVALVSAGATLLLTSALGARLYGAWAGVLAAALLALSATLARWSVTAHPDTLQLALITGGLVAVVAVRERTSPLRLAVAGLLAGLAFGTKYGGVLLLPLIATASACALIQTGWTGRPLLRRVVRDAVLTGGVFALAFALTNPYALIEWRRFLTQLQAEIEHTRTGHVFAEQAAPLNWLRVVASPDGIGLAAAIAAVAGWIVLARMQANGSPVPGRGWQRCAAMLNGRVLIALWTAGYLVYLIGFAGLQEPRYALPALPGLAVGAAGFVALLSRGRSREALAAASLLVLLVLVPAIGPLRAVYAERRAQTAEDGNPRIAAGRWLAAIVATDAAVLADAYVYLPPAVTQRTETFGLTREQVAAVRPVAIAVNDDIRNRFLDDADAGRYVDGAEAFRQRARAYSDLESGRFGCYRLARDFGGVRIYIDQEAIGRGARTGCGAASSG